MQIILRSTGFVIVLLDYLLITLINMIIAYIWDTFIKYNG